MKKVLLLGGSYFQVPSIRCAKKLGYYTITCDYLPDNPGHKYADEYHNVSTTDKEAILKLAQELKIDGIVCYASDPAAPTAAYVAEKMGLPGQPYKSVEILANKDLFRKFLTENDFNVPRAKGFTNLKDALADWENFKKPVMVKPVDSSGSKGVQKIEKVNELEPAIQYALSFSRCKRFIIEEFVKKYGYQIAGDGFSIKGKLIFRYFGNDHFSNIGNPFVPVGASFPYNMPNYVHEKVHNEIQRAFDLLSMNTGAYNFDIRIDQDENVYLMEIGPRNGGDFIPQIIQYATGVDLTTYTIKAAMGEDCSDLTKDLNCQGYWAYYAIHSQHPGKFKKVQYSTDFQNNNIVELHMMVQQNDYIQAYNGSNSTLGVAILKFNSQEEMLYKMDHMNEFIKVIVE